MSFFGMQPTFTQVPPSPHVVPLGEGLTKSRHATFAPWAPASCVCVAINLNSNQSFIQRGEGGGGSTGISPAYSPPNSPPPAKNPK